MQKLSQETIEEIQGHFEFFDEDKNGYIDIKEFIRLLKTIEPATTQSQAVNGFELIDQNNDGLIEVDEFVDWWQTVWYEF